MTPLDYRPRTFLIVLLGFSLVQGCSEPAGERPAAPGASNVILIIGDGMDDQQITIARNYLVGRTGRLVLDDMPFRGAARVETVAEDDPSRPVYVADSANSATTMATGVVTSIGRIATTAQSDRDITTIMELADEAGLGTGIVTTSSVTDATPASFVAHVNQRYCQGPHGMVQIIAALQLRVDCSRDHKSNGGKGSIAEQIAASRLDIVLGGGIQYFEQSLDGDSANTVFDVARENGFTVIRKREDLGNLPNRGKVLGLFSPDTMPVRLRGTNRAQAERVHRVNGEVRLPQPVECEPNPRFQGMPSLAEMTRSALKHLDDRRGFVLMIESASIDKQSHLRQPCGQVSELDQLDETVSIALKYAEAHPETLVLVTADHSHAAQIIADESLYLALQQATPGYVARLQTLDGAVMSINYATNDGSEEVHTGAQVPVFASGPGAEELPTLIRQADIYHISAKHLGLSDGIR